MGSYVTQGTYTFEALSVESVRTPIGVLSNGLLSPAGGGASNVIPDLRPVKVTVLFDNVSDQDMVVGSQADFQSVIGGGDGGGVTPTYTIAAGTKEKFTFTAVVTSAIGSNFWTGDLYIAPSDYHGTTNTGALDLVYMTFAE
jgi:hypothetical protein